MGGNQETGNSLLCCPSGPGVPWLSAFYFLSVFVLCPGFSIIRGNIYFFIAEQSVTTVCYLVTIWTSKGS